MTELVGAKVVLRTAVLEDVAELVRIRSTPEVMRRWPLGHPRGLAAEVAQEMTTGGLEYLTVLRDDSVVGAIQWSAEDDWYYRHANIDIYLDPAVHGQGLGTDAVRTLARHLVDDRGYHRIEIDPATDNEAAIRCYARVGFRPVGVMRQYERGPDGCFHDGLLMDMLRGELRLPAT
jgi:aminoglycoside 6'-N-acetyltransferase